VSNGPVDVGISGTTFTATCPAGTFLVGGGALAGGALSNQVHIAGSWPSANLLAGVWTVVADDGVAIGPNMTVWALCVR
jgi:hypothetical protein